MANDLQVGFEQDGYRYIGGDPADQRSWESTRIKSGTVDSGYRYIGGDPSDQSNWEDVREPGLIERVKEGARNTASYLKASATDDPAELAKIVAERQRTQLPVTEAGAKIAGDIRRSADQMQSADADIQRASAEGDLLGATRGVINSTGAGMLATGVKSLLSNPKETLGMIAENLPNSAPGLAGGLAGAAVGAATPVPGGAVIGGVVGGTAGGYNVEMGGALYDQILKEAKDRGIDPTDENALAPIIAEKQAEFVEKARLKGVGTAGTDAALNALTFGVAGAAERTLVRSANQIGKRVADGTIDATTGAAELAALEAKNAARNTLGSKLTRGAAVTSSEMAGEAASEYAGQKLAYGEADPTDVLLEGLLGAGQGVGMAAGRGLVNKAGQVAGLENYTDVEKAIAQNASVVEASRQREAGFADIMGAADVGTAVDAAVKAADIDLQNTLVPELASDIDAYKAASLRALALNPSDALELAAAKGAIGRVGSLDLSQPAAIAAPASEIAAAGDKAAREVEAAGGVATPAQAAILDRAFPGQKMYDQVVGSSEQAPTVSNNSPIITEPGRAPRETVSFANPLEAENAEGWKRFAANQKQAAQTVANEATSVANQAPQVNVNNVISALQTTPGLQTAEQRVTLNAARQNLSPEDFQLLETAAVNRGNLSAEQQIRLRFMEKQGVSPQNQETPVSQENQATLSAQRTDEQETRLPQAELVYSPTKMGDGYRLVGTQNVNGREMFVYADESVTPTTAPNNTQLNQPSVPEMGTNVPNMGTTEPVAQTFTPKQGVATLESTATGNDEVGSTGTVNSDGKAYQYTVVESGVAPGVSGAIRQLARLFGKNVVFFNSDLAADGFVQPGKDSAIYINANSKMSPMAVFGHELMHLLKRDNPIAYRAIAAVVGRNLKGDAAANFRTYYNNGSPSSNEALTDAEMEEMVADLLGNEFTQESFLSDVFNEIGQLAPEGQARSIILRLAATINKAIKAALNVIKGLPVSQAFQTEQMVNNLEDIRAALRTALKDYAIQQKESAAKMAMEFTRETSLIQLSPSRENTTPNQNANQSTADRMDLGATLQTQGAENAAENDTGRIRSVQQNPGENRPGSVGYGRDQNDQIPSFGTDGGRAGSIRVQGVHYSKGQLSHVDGNFYGSNVSRSNGAEAERVRLARDRRITKRGYFYINTGNGIKPEANVGSVPHTAYLNNLYDTATGLITAADENSFESAVLDAGFDGFINRSAGMAVVLDNKQVPVVPSDGTAEVVPAADKTTSVRAELSSIKSLPSGELTRERWGQVLKSTRPDLYEKIEPSGAFNGEERVYKDGLVKFSPPREYKMDLAKENRAISKAAGLTQEETAMVKAEAKKLGLTNVRTEELLTSARETKKQYPQSAGWAPIKLVGLKANTNEDTGETTVDLKWQEGAYAFNRAPGVNRAPPKMDRAWADKVAKSFHGLIKDIFDRAAAGDKNAQIIISHQTWYRNVAEVLRREYGGFGDLLADLLGATSPNTPVDTNWKFSIDAMRRFVRGDFNAELERFDQFVKDGGRVSDFPSADKIRQASGKLYGMNSDKAMKAMLDMWRILEKGSAPKARNFALNLIGQSNMATIDVWAARMIRRAANLVRGAKYPRIPPPAEKGVTGEWNASTTGVTGEFGFGAYVMDLVSEMLTKEGINVTPPDLQAIAWFAEKELWGTNRWTTVTGEGGSFEENIDAMPVERFMAGWSIQQGEKVPDEGDASIAQVRVGSVLSGDESVVAFRVMPSHGLYGNTVEQSFDTEWTVLKGEHDPSLVMAEIARIARDYDQFDIFVSRVLAPDENNPNARPGVEVYFKNKRALDQAMPILERFTARGQDGFTMVVDPRTKTPGEYIGIRLQYVPEISMRWDERLRKTLLEPGGIEAELDAKRHALQDIVSELAAVDGVAYAKAFNYDTVVVGKENYDAYIDRAVAGGYRQAGSEVWFGQPIRQGLERAVTRYERNDGQVGSGGVSDVGVSEVRDSAQEVKLSPPRFYSQLERTIEQVPSRLATQPASQWKAWLASNSAKFGIKKDEIEWSGINNYLDLRGKDKVTADEIGQFLNLNNVKVTEVAKGEPEGTFLRMPGGAEYGDNSGTKYGQWVLPGGDNYREMLLTLPDNNRSRLEELIQKRSELEASYQKAGKDIPDSVLPEWRALNSEIKELQYSPKQAYRSSHWDESNILAHIRMNDRTDADGNKVLFVEEIQSDWAQAGRKRGFVGDKEMVSAYQVSIEGKPVTAYETRAEAEAHLERAALYNDRDAISINEVMLERRDLNAPQRVPDAPFVKNTKDWVALAVKRVMLLAAQGNYDKVAFVNGQQSVDRYNLAKRIDKVEYTEGGALYAWDKDGNEVMRKKMPESEVEDHIGKDLAEKLLTSEKGKYNSRTLTGTELEVGGEGMKSFYDRIVPQVVNDVLKRLGGRTESVSLEFDPNPELDQWIPEDGEGDGSKAPIIQSEQLGFTVTPEMRQKLQGEGLPLFSRQRNTDVEFTQPFNIKKADNGNNGRDGFWGRLSAGDSFSTAQLASAYAGSINRPVSAEYRGRSGGETVFEWPGQVAGFKGYYTLAGNDRDGVFNMLVIPKELLPSLDNLTTQKLADSTIIAYTAQKASDGRLHISVVEANPGSPAYLALENNGRIKQLSNTTPDGTHAYSQINLGHGMSYRLLREFARRYGVQNGDIPDVYFSRDTGATAGSTRSYTSDEVKAKFSPSRQSIADAVAGYQFKQEIVNQAKYKLADIISPGNGFNWFHKTVGTQFHKAKVNPLFKKVFDLGQQFLDDVTLFATRAEDKAADIFPRFGLSKSLLKTGLSKSDNQLIARALTDGTLENGADPHTGVVWSDEELRSKYGMNDNQIGYYRQARAALDQSLDDLAKSEMATHMRIAMKANITPLIRADISLADVRDMLIQSLDAGIASTTNEDAAKMLQKTKSHINGIYSTTTNLKNHGYAPLMRFGNYTVTAYDENGDVAFFQMTDTKSEASLMAKNLEGEFDRIETGKMSAEAHKLFKGITPDTLELFAKHTALGNDAMTQAYLQLAVSSRSAMKRLINRKGTTGYSLDATRTLATFLTSNARKSSSALNISDMKQAADAIPREDGDVKDEAVKLVEYLQNPGEEAAKLRGFLFFQYLGGSIASGIVNLTQPILQTYPYLSQFGTGQAASAMKTGTVAATHFLRGKRVGDPNLQAALEKAKAEGLIDPQEIYQLMAASQSGAGSFLSYKLMRLWGINFGVTEIMNRTVTFAAAFKVGQSLSKEELQKAGAKDAYSFAQGAIYETQGLYNKGNRPDWARGAVGGTIFTFKQYSISYLEFITRLYKNDKKAFGIALAILIMASGLQGLPGADDLDDVIDTAGNWMGYATNTKKWKREFLESVLGKDMAAFALHGMSSLPGMPIDVQARLGLGNIIPGTGLLNPTKKDKAREVAEVFGVAGGLAMSTLDTAEAVARGDVRRAALSILPGAVRNLIQAGEMAATGEYRDTRGRLVQKVDGGDVIAKAIGFQPAEIAAGNRRMREVQADIDIVKTKQEEVNGKYARAIVDKDQAAMAEVRAEMQDWNQKNPDLRIKFNMSAIQQRVKQARLTKEARFIKSAPQQIRQQVREAVLAD